MNDSQTKSPSISKPTAHERYKVSLFRRATAPFRALPDYLILGAQKAGTTTVYDNLVKHPGILPCDIKEVHFFDQNWDKGLNWYKAHFPYLSQVKVNREIADRRITGEGSPYYLFHPAVPERVKSVVPAAKLIVVLRNPADRAYSHYQHGARKGRDPLSFEEAIENEASRLKGEREKLLADPSYQSFSYQHYSYIHRGFYAQQLKEWFKVFPRKQFFIMTNEELAENFQDTFRRLHEFLGIAAFEVPAVKTSNVGNYSRLESKTVERLKEIFREPNKELEDLLERKLNWD